MNGQGDGDKPTVAYAARASPRRCYGFHHSQIALAGDEPTIEEGNHNSIIL